MMRVDHHRQIRSPLNDPRRHFPRGSIEILCSGYVCTRIFCIVQTRSRDSVYQPRVICGRRACD